MNLLEAQISQITVPQEFTRLCNAVLSAEHGDDYLPIDDDRSDRGNDGYVKSERRLFAVHCFKRPQNQGLDKAIRNKMVSDLRKAIALKNEGTWDIERWTFLSNYPISEAVAAQVLSIGKEAGIDVAWRGPAFLATALERHTSIRRQFPELYLPEVDEHLAQIEIAVGTLATDRSAMSTVRTELGVPRTEAEQQELLLTRPDGWEYLLFAGVLLQGKEALEFKWRDHELGLRSGARRRLDLAEAYDYLGSAFGDLSATIESMMPVFAEGAQEQAFGTSGTSGDPVRIEHFAQRIIKTYNGILDWAAEWRALEVPGVYEEVFDTAPRMVDRPLEEIRDFIHEAVTEIGKIPAHLADPDPDKEPLTINLQLSVTADEEVSREFNSQLKRAKKRIQLGQLGPTTGPEAPESGGTVASRPRAVLTSVRWVNLLKGRFLGRSADRLFHRRAARRAAWRRRDWRAGRSGAGPGCNVHQPHPASLRVSVL